MEGIAVPEKKTSRILAMDRICRNKRQLIGHEDPSNLRYSQHRDSRHSLPVGTWWLGARFDRCKATPHGGAMISTPGTISVVPSQRLSL
jgi:hypothetical protein